MAIPLLPSVCLNIYCLIMSQRSNPTYQSNLMTSILSSNPAPLSKKPVVREAANKESAQKQVYQKPQSPYKPPDQPINSFYPTESKPLSARPAHPKVDASNHKYYVNSQVLTLNNQQRRQYDNTSEIFGDRVFLKQTATTPEPKINSKSQWSDIHIGSIKCQVNENAHFAIDYARLKKREDLKSENICKTDRHPAPAADPWDRVNIEAKKQNHQFSDLFGQELGHRSSRKQLHRSMSPNIKWTEFDTIRNQKDYEIEDREQVRNFVDGQKSAMDHHQYEGQKVECLSENVINCKLTFDKIKGLYKQNFQDFRDSVQLGQEHKIQVAKKHKYQGIYAWKKNYQK